MINFRNIGATFRPLNRGDANKQGKGVYECDECGSVVSNPESHQEWHDQLLKNLFGKLGKEDS
jgi:hypothetical protein